MFLHVYLNFHPEYVIMELKILNKQRILSNRNEPFWKQKCIFQLKVNKHYILFKYNKTDQITNIKTYSEDNFIKTI